MVYNRGMINKEQLQMPDYDKKKLMPGLKLGLLRQLDWFRPYYDLYDEDDKQVIDAIYTLKEELTFNCEDEDETKN